MHWHISHAIPTSETTFCEPPPVKNVLTPPKGPKGGPQKNSEKMLKGVWLARNNRKLCKRVYFCFMTTDKVKSWLSSFQRLEYEYISLVERYENYKNAQYYPAMRMGDEAKHTPSAFDRMGNATIRRMDFEDMYAEKIAELKAEMNAIEAAIKTVPDPMHRAILIQRYIIGHDGYKLKPWRAIAIQLYRHDDDADLKRVQRIHREAVASLAAISNNQVADRQF